MSEIDGQDQFMSYYLCESKQYDGIKKKYSLLANYLAQLILFLQVHNIKK